MTSSSSLPQDRQRLSESLRADALMEEDVAWSYEIDGERDGEQYDRTERAALCVAPWTGDLHADHEAAGRAAAAAARETGTPCWHYPVWMWHWASPGDPRVPWSAARRLPLSRPARTRKEAAIRRFASQLAPLGPGDDTVILPPVELAHHTRPFEVVFT